MFLVERKKCESSSCKYPKPPVLQRLQAPAKVRYIVRNISVTTI
jgi:hypothetical protein